MIFKVKRELIARRRIKEEMTVYLPYFHKYCTLLDICRKTVIQGNKFIYLSSESCVFLSQDLQLPSVINLQS